MSDLRPILTLQPIHSSSAEMLRSFAQGKPLTADQVHFLEWHQHTLSSAHMDPLLKYYLHSRPQSQKRNVPLSFLLPHEEINKDAIELLKKRLMSTLQQKNSSAVLRLTQRQFLQFKQYTHNDLIFWHGNQFLTGAPFYHGGLAPVIYFQWGNVFGVVKAMVLPEEKNLKANILVYFEDMQDRLIDQCVLEYDKELDKKIQHQNEVFFEYTHAIKPPALTEEPHPAPGMKLTNYFLIDKLEK